MDFESLNAQLERARYRFAGRPVANNTRLVDISTGNMRGVGVKLHNTVVVGYFENGEIVLNSGGWRTVTTKDRINNWSPARIHSFRDGWKIGAVVLGKTEPKLSKCRTCKGTGKMLRHPWETTYCPDRDDCQRHKVTFRYAWFVGDEKVADSSLEHARARNPGLAAEQQKLFVNMLEGAELRPEVIRQPCYGHLGKTPATVTDYKCHRCVDGVADYGSALIHPDFCDGVVIRKDGNSVVLVEGAEFGRRHLAA